MTQHLNFAIIGCGRIAPHHIGALEQIPEARLAMVADILPERAKAFGDLYGVPWTADYRDVLKSDSVDVVNICTPSGLHAQMGIAAAKAGKHIVVEKPMALTLEDADALISTAEEEGVTLAVVFQNRFNPTVQELRRALEQGRFGKLTHGNAAIRWTRGQDYYDSGSWRGTWALDGGAFMNQSIHNIDLLQWMLGPVQKLGAFTATALRNMEAEDVGAAVLHFANGSIGIIEAATTIYPDNLEETLGIFGESGTAVIGGVAINQMRYWRFADGLDNEDEVLRAHTSPEPSTVYGLGHRPLLQNVINAILGREELLVDGREGRKALEIILAVYLSAEKGEMVELPLKEMPSKIAKGKAWLVEHGLIS